MNSHWSNRNVFKKYLDARSDFLRGWYKLAIDKLLPLDAVSKNDDINHLLVRCLYHRKSYHDAEQILLADVNSYTVNRTLINLMIQVFLKNHEFIICREVITSFNDSRLKRESLKRVQNYEDCLARNKPKVIKRIAKSFYHLSNGSLIHQRITLRNAQRLPMNTFCKVAKGLLIDPFLAPIMRLSILDTLRKIGFHDRLKYRWIDKQIYLIDVSSLSALTETQSYNQIMKIIKSKYYHDPTRMLALKQNLRLDLSYLYPFNDQKVTDPGLWVKIAALRIKGEQPIFKNERIKVVYYLQVKLNQFTKNLVK